MNSTADYPGGVAPKALPHGFFFRRVAVLVEDDRVRAAVEDESHHMELHLYHDGTRVTALQGITHRIPWSECPAAPARLPAFVGLSLRRMHESTGLDGREQCTHLFDLTRLAMARALVGTSVQYDIGVEDRIDNCTNGQLLRDGKPVMRWDVKGTKVMAPAPFIGHSVFGMAEWPPSLDDDTLEAALVLRRVFLIAGIREPWGVVTREPQYGRFNFLKTMKVGHAANRCYNFHSDRIEGVSYRQTWRDYSNRRDELLKHFPGMRTLAELQAAI
jgi:hypothetical protein